MKNLLLRAVPTQQWQRDALSALLILTLPSSIASQCTLLATRAC
ncbi:hypothetical protein [Corynebacterium senegalense]|nr:hypothetical protein [Corynebacterium senegalense]